MEYPTEDSLLLPVLSSSQPKALERPIRITARMRLWRFSSVRPGGRSPNDGSSMPMSATWAGSMGTVRRSMPRLSASSSASVIEWSLE